MVEFKVKANGKVASPKILKSTHKGFEAAAIDALVKWTFKPGRIDGRRVTMGQQARLVFQQEGNSSRPPIVGNFGPVYPYNALLENQHETVECTVMIGATGEVFNVSWSGTPSEEFKGAIVAMLDT